ncbi:LamG domain-containing protein, partial [Yeosuana sp.]|uniref:LamG domain-containing protein n=1 Tax=Yeosuana sp. TaxID=2529388 RepID=UPI0040552DEB
MRRYLPLGFFLNFCLILLFLFGFDANAQVTQVEIQGGLPVDPAIPVSITTGSSLTFRVTNGETNNCRNLRVSDINLSGATGGTFSISPSNPRDNIKPASCNGDHDLLFSVSRTDSGCSIASVTVTLLTNDGDFVFTFEVTRSPEIYVLGGSPYSDINHGDIATSDTNGTFFGVVSEGDVVVRYYIVANIGGCGLDVSSLSSSNPDYVVFSPYSIPVTIPSYFYIVIGVRFTAPISPPLPTPQISGTQRATISIFNTDNTTFNFDVTAEMFNYKIPGPGGVTASIKLWLKTTRGITKTGSNLTNWQDVGSNSKDASADLGKEPTYLDDVASNINFNPVIKFVNNGVGTEQYLYNSINGFYSQDVFIVTIPDAPMTSTSGRNTIFGGIDTGSINDVTGIGFGDYSTRFSNETLSYNQNVASPTGSYNGTAELNSTYSKAGIINVRNNLATSPTKQDILYNSNPLITSNVTDVPFTNLGSSGLGSKYWLGKNQDGLGNFNGRIAEIFTFGSRLTDADCQKVESYLAIKYGITLGPSNEATKDYINSFGDTIWNISKNAGYNFDVAGIGRDSISDLNQKQSKTINSSNGVTIGLGGLFATNSANPNEFENDGDFLVWGHDDGAFSGASPNTVTIASGITTSLTRIDRKWKIVENTEVEGSDVENVFVGIPTIVLSSLSKTANEEYVLIVADNANFYDGDIIDVIPLKINIDINGSPILDQNGNQVYKAWYDFNETKYFTFGIAAKFTGNHSLNIASGDFLVGEYELNLNVDSFTISAWIKSASNPSTRTIMAKGEKLQLRLNSLNQIEVMIEDDKTPKYTSTMTIGDGKWHQLTFVYNSGSIFLYVDGVLDKSVQNVVHPSPNYNHFSIGAIYKNHSPVNSFIGQIDEVYVWDIALSEDQIRYLMNQEIERFDNSETDYVSGKTLPQMAANNPISAIPWRRLRAYYDFNSFYGSTVAGLTDNRFFLRLQYLKKDKTVIVDQTIPAPYVSAADGAWDDPATWSNSSDQMIPNTLGLDGTTIVDWNIVETTHNITSGDRDIKVLALKNDSGTITIAKPLPELQDETNSGQGLTITNYLELDGVIDLVGESQLVQTEGSILDEDSGGYIIRHQQGTANGFNYNYWSSSVGPVGIDTGSPTGISSTNADYTIKDVLKDG